MVLLSLQAEMEVASHLLSTPSPGQDPNPDPIPDPGPDPNPDPGDPNPDPTRSRPASAHRELGPGAMLPSTQILDLSERGLHHLGVVLPAPNLKQLHLQRNALCSIPEDFFQLLPHLTWLDLRYNRIRALPPGIGAHRHLKTLLLERNPIKMLPVELGRTTSLKALSLRLCPLEFPPQLVVQKGLAAILQFLRVCAATQGCSERLVPGGTAQEAVAGGQSGSGLLEGLDPGQRQGSTDPREDWPSTHEIRRFWALRQEIVGTEQAEALAGQLLPLELPPNLQAALRPQDQEPCHGLEQRGRSYRPTLPALAQTRRTQLQAQRPEQHRAPALREPRTQLGGPGPQHRDRQVLAQRREPRKEPQAGLPAPRGLVTLSSDLRASGRPVAKATWSWEQTVLPREGTSAQRMEGLARMLGQQRQTLARMRHREEPLEGLRKATQHLATGRELWEQMARLRRGQAWQRGCELPTLAAPQNMLFSTKY